MIQAPCGDYTSMTLCSLLVVCVKIDDTLHARVNWDATFAGRTRIPHTFISPGCLVKTFQASPSRLPTVCCLLKRSDHPHEDQHTSGPAVHCRLDVLLSTRNAQSPGNA